MAHIGPVKEAIVHFNPLGFSLECEDCGYRTTNYPHQRFGYARVDLELHHSQNLSRKKD